MYLDTTTTTTTWRLFVGDGDSGDVTTCAIANSRRSFAGTGAAENWDHFLEGNWMAGFLGGKVDGNKHLLTFRIHGDWYVYLTIKINIM